MSATVNQDDSPPVARTYPRAEGLGGAGMNGLETIGYYDDAPGSQKYPPPLGLFYPAEGNFIAFLGNLASRNLVRQVVGAFRQNEQFPSEGAALPEVIPRIGDSDHTSFWHDLLHTWKV
jgi:hypothetical protein